MAKVFGGLLSLDASKTFGNVITFARWKGVQYARLRVTPSNPRTPNQVKTRLFTAMAGKVTKATDTLSPLADFLRGKAPSGQSQASYFIREMLGTGNANAEEAQTDYKDEGNSVAKGYFDTVAGTTVLENATVPGADNPIPKGQALWTAYAAAYRLGYALAPVAPKSATQVQIESFAATMSAD